MRVVYSRAWPVGGTHQQQTAPVRSAAAAVVCYQVHMEHHLASILPPSGHINLSPLTQHVYRIPCSNSQQQTAAAATTTGHVHAHVCCSDTVLWGNACPVPLFTWFSFFWQLGSGRSGGARVQRPATGPTTILVVARMVTT